MLRAHYGWICSETWLNERRIWHRSSLELGKHHLLCLPKLDCILNLQIFSALEVKHDFFCNAAKQNAAVSKFIEGFWKWGWNYGGKRLIVWTAEEQQTKEFGRKENIITDIYIFLSENSFHTYCNICDSSFLSIASYYYYLLFQKFKWLSWHCKWKLNVKNCVQNWCIKIEKRFWIRILRT